jgi:signal transduction histidine kinase
LAGTQLGGGSHVCAFFDGPEDEYRMTLPFVREGLEQNELAFHIVDPAGRASYARRLEQAGIPVAELEKSGQFDLRTWPETYLRYGEFNPDAMLALIEEVLQHRTDRFPLLRLIGHVDFPHARPQTWNDWVSYEARLNRVLSKYPDAMVCAYQISHCDGRLVLDLLRTHPVVIIGGLILSSPIYLPTDEFLAALGERVSPPPDTVSPDVAERDRTLELYEQVLATVGHDLGNPLSAVIMGASAIEMDRGMPATAVHIASRILASAARMNAIIGDLLDVANQRVSGGMKVKPKATDAHGLCARIVEELRVGNPGREIRLRVEGDGEGWWDPNRLGQAVSNLVANALQYGAVDAPVTVECRGTEAEWSLSVHNLGPPISPEVRLHLFEPFRRGRQSSSGQRHLGIGLFIVRRVIEAHGGTIETTSGRDEGTRFVVHLPKR